MSLYMCYKNKSDREGDEEIYRLLGVSVRNPEVDGSETGKPAVFWCLQKHTGLWILAKQAFVNKCEPI